MNYMLKLDMLVSEREWPVAVYHGPMRRMAGMFLCETPYSKAAQRDGAHGPITLVIMRYDTPGFPNGRRVEYLDKKFYTVQTALLCLMSILNRKPEWQPKLV
jgi:hypothetical protein